MSKMIGIDIGARYIRTVIPSEKMTISEEPALTAVDDRGTVVAYGKEAMLLDSRAPGSVTLKRLIPEDGSEIDASQAFYVFSKIIKSKRMKGAELYLSLSGCCGGNDEAVFVDAAQRGGAGDVIVINPVYAAANGCGVRSAGDSLVVNIGYASVDMTSFSHGKKVASSSNEFSAISFSNAIISYISEKYHMNITMDEAEKIKHELGSMTAGGNRTAEFRMLRKTLGLPKKLVLTENEISSVMEPIFDELADSIIALIRSLSCEPDKVILTGGGAKLNGLAPALSPLVCLPVEVSERPELAVVRGLAAIALQTEGKR